MTKAYLLATNRRVAHQMRVIADLVEEERYGAAWDELRDALVEIMDLAKEDTRKILPGIPSASPTRRNAAALTACDPGRPRFEVIDELLRDGWYPLHFGGSGILVDRLPKAVILCRRIRNSVFGKVNSRGETETIKTRVRDAIKGAITWMDLLPNRGVIA